mgnify:CR=1 FL=1
MGAGVGGLVEIALFFGGFSCAQTSAAGVIILLFSYFMVCIFTWFCRTFGPFRAPVSDSVHLFSGSMHFDK